MFFILSFMGGASVSGVDSDQMADMIRLDFYFQSALLMKIPVEEVLEKLTEIQLKDLALKGIHIKGFKDFLKGPGSNFRVGSLDLNTYSFCRAGAFAPFECKAFTSDAECWYGVERCESSIGGGFGGSHGVFLR
ncbi:MAG: hypothetical protein ACMUEM_04820 [Flavobacteriales bacterium AspAUS03]